MRWFPHHIPAKLSPSAPLHHVLQQGVFAFYYGDEDVDDGAHAYSATDGYAAAVVVYEAWRQQGFADGA